MADRSEGQAAYSREVRSRVDLEGPLLYRTMRRDVRVDREVRAEGYTEKARGTGFTMNHKCGGQAEKVNATACEVLRKLEMFIKMNSDVGTVMSAPTTETEVMHGHGHRGMRWTVLGWNREGAKFVRRAQCGGYELLMAGSSRCHDGGTQAVGQSGQVMPLGEFGRFFLNLVDFAHELS